MTQKVPTEHREESIRRSGVSRVRLTKIQVASHLSENHKDLNVKSIHQYILFYLKV